MPSDFRIGVLLVGAIFLLAAVLSGRISGNAIRTAVGKFARAAVGIAGAVLIVWGFGVLPRFVHAAGYRTRCRTCTPRHLITG
jgi:hypothetical protein